METMFKINLIYLTNEIATHKEDTFNIDVLNYADAFDVCLNKMQEKIGLQNNVKENLITVILTDEDGDMTIKLCGVDF